MDSTPVTTKPPPWRRGLRLLSRLLIVGLLALSAIVIGLRLLLPHIDNFRPQIAEHVSDLLGQTVSINQLQAEWRGWKTIDLTMQGVSLLSETGTESVLELKRARVTIDIVATVLEGQLLPGNLVVAGARFALIRESDGSFTARGLEENEEAPATESGPNSRDTFANWVLSQEELGLESVTLLWHDRRSGRAPITLTDVNIHTYFDGADRHRVSGSATLPAELGEILSFDLDILGDPLSRNWSGSVGLQADRVNLSALSGVHESFGLSTAGGTISVKLDTEWAMTRLTVCAGNYHLENAQFEWPTGHSEIEAATGQFRLERDAGGWRLDVAQEQFKSRHGTWPPMQAHIELRRGDTSDSPSTFAARIGYTRIEDVLPLAINFLPQKLHPALRHLDVQGELEKLEIDVALVDGELSSLDVKSAISNLSSPPRGHVPGLSGLSGQLNGDLFQGSFLLDSDALTITIPRVFAQPLELSESRGEITWKRRGTGWWFETPGLSLANSELAGAVIGKVHWPYGNTLPILDIGVEVDSADLGQLDSFLPVGLLRPRFASWLQRAVKAGRIVDTQLHYRGYAGDFPFDSGEDSLRVRGRVENLDLEYSTRWPPITQSAGEFRVDDAVFELTATSGTVFGSTIEGGSAHIPDLSHPTPSLSINTQVSGTAENGLRFLREGSLADRFGGFARALEADSDIVVDLTVLVPLPTGKKTAKGSISLLGNTVSLKKVNITFADVTGQLGFTPNGMSAQGIEAVYLDTPISLDLGRNAQLAGTSQVTIKGKADKAFLLRQLHALALFANPADPPRVLSQIEGVTQWQATVDLPDRWGTTSEHARVQVVSNLEGLGFGLPAPFGKPAEQSKLLVVDTRFSPGAHRNVKIRYGSDIGSQFELKADKEGYLLNRGAVVFGDSSPSLPIEKGLYVGGQLERLSIDHWSEIMTEPGRSETTDEPTDYPILRVLKEVEIRTTELELLGNVFDGAHINVSRNNESRWRVRVKGNSVDGEVLFPTPNERGEPIIVALDKLRLGKIEEDLETANRYDPRRFPPLRFSAKNIIYDDVNIGTISFSTSPRPNGLSVDSLLLLSEGFEASSVGTWTSLDGKHRSQFVTELHADELDQLLHALGQEESTAQGGATDILVTLDWPGSPSQFSLKSMSGIVHLRANRGRLLDINPGATGRLVGFLMMTSLPRRLKLDFSDLFDAGIIYKWIEGSFAIENGHAYTNNLLVESETAKIEIAGRTGLIAEDYDQVVTITPRLASSLPLAPVWLLEKVLQREIFDKAFSYQYTITGSWDDPQIERIAIETETKLEDEQAER